MREAMEQLGHAVAEQALADVSGRSFGAVTSLELAQVLYSGADGNGDDAASGGYWELIWCADCTGDSRDIHLVVLPEFLEMEPELLVSQLAMLLADRVIESFAG
ncbi:hypothetical protein JW859_09955 [bacterium]|nr:hypothetical protein [bacterium]